MILFQLVLDSHEHLSVYSFHIEQRRLQLCASLQHNDMPIFDAVVLAHSNVRQIVAAAENGSISKNFSLHTSFRRTVRLFNDGRNEPTW